MQLNRTTSGDGSRSATDSTIVRSFRIAGLVGGIIAFLISTTIVFSYAFDLPWKIGFRVTPTAIALCLSLSLLLFHTSESPTRLRIRTIQILSFITMYASLMTLLEYASGRSLGVDLPFVGTSVGTPFDTPVSRMAPNSALAFFFIASSVFLQSFSKRFIRTAQILALLAALISMLALIGYSYGVGTFYSIAGIAAMSLLGAVSFLLLSFSAFVIQPKDGLLQLLTSSRAGGSTARWLFVALLVVPPLLGLISLRGYKFGAYDAAFSISLLVIMAMIVFAALTALLAVRLEDADARRSAIEDKLNVSREELRELSLHVQAVQEEERIRIAREIHDELGQSLTALKMDVSVLKGNTPDADDELRGKLDGMILLVDNTIRSVQRISTELRPGVLDDLGLTAALEWQLQEFQRRTGILCSLVVTPQEVLTDQARSTALFRIFQETLTNVARHSFASRVSIELREDDDELLLRISDDGRGISAQSLTRTESIGLLGMRERAKLLGGTIEITGIPGAGTTVEVKLPLDAFATV